MGDVVRFPRTNRPGFRPVPDEAPALEPLWREAVGRELRAERLRQERTLTDVASSAGISMQHLSEVERGLKEPSSEVLAAVQGALGLRLVDLTTRVGQSLSTSVSRGPAGPSGPVCLAV